MNAYKLFGEDFVARLINQVDDLECDQLNVLLTYHTSVLQAFHIHQLFVVLVPHQANLPQIIHPHLSILVY